MNNYWLNQIRRSGVGRAKRLIACLGVMLVPARMERKWRRHVNEMQNALNDEHWKRNDWYVSNGEMCYNWMKFRAYKGGLVYRVND